jgi:hypothetical protein
MSVQCDFVSTDGTRCRSFVIKKDTRCFSHSENSSVIARRTKARVKGGFNARSKGKAVIPDAKPPQSIQEAESLLASVYAKLLRGEVDAQIASVASKLCRDFTRVHKDSHLEREIEELKHKFST